MPESGRQQKLRPGLGARGRAPRAIALCGTFLLGCGLVALGAIAALALPSGGAAELLEQVQPGCLELVANHPEAEEPDPHVVLRSRCVVFAAAARRCLAPEGLGGERESELNVGLDLARVRRPVEEPQLDRSAKEEAVQVEPVVALMQRAT